MRIFELSVPPYGINRHPRTIVRGSLVQLKDASRRFFAAHKVTHAEVREHELLAVDAGVLIRTGTLYADRRVVWRKT